MMYNFDEITNRHGTSSYKWDHCEGLFGDKNVLPMWVADMDFPAPPEVIDVLKLRAEHGIFGYTFRSDSYYDSILQWMERRHRWSIKKEWISTSPGVVTALSILISTLTELQDKILIQSPVYPPFHEVVRQNKRELVINSLKLENGRYTMDYEELEKQFQSGVRMMLLCSPHNPIGRVWTKEELERLGALCVKYQVLVVADEIHGDLIYPGQTHYPFATISDSLHQQTVTCISPSKTFNLAGLQSSFVIIPHADYRNRYNEYLHTLHLEGESSFGVPAVEAAYRYGEPWLEALMHYLEQNVALVQDFFTHHIPEIKVIEPEGTYLVWLDCRKLGLNARELGVFMAKEAMVGLNQGSTFGKNGEGFMRMNIACPRSVVKEGLERIAQAVKNKKAPI